MKVWAVMVLAAAPWTEVHAAVVVVSGVAHAAGAPAAGVRVALCVSKDQGGVVARDTTSADGVYVLTAANVDLRDGWVVSEDASRRGFVHVANFDRRDAALVGRPPPLDLRPVGKPKNEEEVSRSLAGIIGTYEILAAAGEFDHNQIPPFLLQGAANVLAEVASAKGKELAVRRVLGKAVDGLPPALRSANQDKRWSGAVMLMMSSTDKDATGDGPVVPPMPGGPAPRGR